MTAPGCWLYYLNSAFIFGLTVCGFAGVHAYYIIRNETTIEHLADRPNEIRADFDMSGQNFEVVSVPVDDNLWERKKMENWVSVMGRNPWGWFRKYCVCVCVCLAYGTCLMYFFQFLFNEDWAMALYFSTMIICSTRLWVEQWSNVSPWMCPTMATTTITTFKSLHMRL